MSSQHFFIQILNLFFSTDPCRDFDECGANAICQAVSHAPTCSCPAGLRELNSPYEACVPEGMNLSELECLRNSDCQTGFACKEWQCKEISDNLWALFFSKTLWLMFFRATYTKKNIL